MGYTKILFLLSMWCVWYPYYTQLTPTTPITVVQAVAPTYPPLAASNKIEGTVIVEVKVDANGIVQSTKIIEGHKLLHRVAESFARRWIFNKDLAETSLRSTQIKFSFKLMPENTPEVELSPIFIPPYTVEIRGIKPNFVWR